MRSQELTREQLEIIEYYRNEGLICEFLEDIIESPPDAPFVLFDHQRVALRAIWDYQFVYLVWARRLGKTFTLAHAIAALATLLSGTRQSLTIGVLSGTHRQVRIIFNEIRNIYYRSPFLQSISLKEPKIYPDRCEWQLKGFEGFRGVSVEGYPLNSQKGSDTIRGFGFPILFLDEFQIIPEKSYKSIFPTAAASANPALRVLKLRSRSDSFDKNRLILSGTAYWEFAPAYRVFNEFQRCMQLNMKVNELFRELGEIDEDDQAEAEDQETGERDPPASAGGSEEEILSLEPI